MTCFAPLLRWILTWWVEGEHRLALAMDGSTLSSRFTVLAVSIVYRECVLLVGWCIVRAKPGSQTNRGLYSSFLYQHLVAQGWHPFLRVNLGGKARPKGSDTYHWLATFAPVVGYHRNFWADGEKTYL